MTVEIILVLVMIGVSLVPFSLERLPTDVIALGVLLALVLTGLLPADKAFAGFGSDTVIMMLGLLIVAAALVRTGAVNVVGRVIVRFTGGGHNRLLAVIRVAAATVSGLMSNAASTALFVPITLGLASRARVSASKLLLPLAFASVLASSVTLVSSSTNLVVSGLMTQYGLAPIGMLELTSVGVPVVAVGLLALLLVGRRLLPDRGEPGELADEFGIRRYLTEVLILPDSSLIGKTLAQSGLAETWISPCSGSIGQSGAISLLRQITGCRPAMCCW
jgi:di/tricarboxylate transporter